MATLCNYYLTSRCNSRCYFCDLWRDEGSSELKEQAIEEVVGNLKALKKLGIKTVEFKGGEPLLYAHVIEALQAAKNHGFKTKLTTNCILYPRYAKRLAGLVDTLFFLLYASNANEHDQIAGVQSYDKVQESIAIAKKIRQKVLLFYTVTASNIKDIPALIDFAQKNQCVIYLNLCFDQSILTQELMTVLLNYSQMPYVLMNLALLKLISQGGNQIDSPICEGNPSTIVISPENYLLLPCFQHCQKKIKIENNLDELYQEAEIKEIRDKVGRFSFCQGCIAANYLQVALSKNFPCLAFRSWLKNSREMMRKQF